jgi:hypothetical protein
MIYGVPELNFTLDRTDRVGLRSLVVSLAWGMNHVPVEWAELLLALDAAEPPPPGTPPGMEYMGRDRTSEFGALQTHWTYQGIHAGNGKDVSFKDRSHSLDWRFDPGFAQVALALHPNLAATGRERLLRAVDLILHQRRSRRALRMRRARSVGARLRTSCSRPASRRPTTCCASTPASTSSRSKSTP